MLRKVRGLVEMAPLETLAEPRQGGVDLRQSVRRLVAVGLPAALGYRFRELTRPIGIQHLEQALHPGEQAILAQLAGTRWHGVAVAAIEVVVTAHVLGMHPAPAPGAAEQAPEGIRARLSLGS